MAEMALRTRENGMSKVRGVCMPSLGDAEESSPQTGRGQGWFKLILLWLLCALFAGRSWQVKPSLIFLTSLTGGSVRSARKRRRPWLAASAKTLSLLTSLWMTKQRDRHLMNFTGSSSSLCFKETNLPWGLFPCLFLVHSHGTCLQQEA